MSDTDFVYQAVARAKQVAAKLAAGGDMSSHNNGSVDASAYPTTTPTIGIKRPASDVISAPAEKRTMVNDKLSAAAEAAAKINEKLGAPSAYSNPLANQTLTISHRIPDKYVGLVIGKKGEQIIQLQSDSQCKVQISQEGGLPERELTMIGNPAQIEKAKQMINDIIERAGGSIGNSGGAHSIDVMIPGLKAGLVIGKNGETIKHLQEVTGAKMVLIQETNNPTSDDKPLRITGEASCVEKAKDMVIQLLANKDTKSYPKMAYVQPPENADLCVYAVPTEKAGLVIGKGGETIREICVRSGAFVEISKQQTADPAIKLFNVRGQRHEIDNAIRFISERAGIPVGPPHAYYPNGQNATQAAAYGGQAWGSYAAPSAAAASQQAWSQNTASAMPPPTMNPHTGQPDYSAAWAEYYRRQGLHEYADMILRQAQQGVPVASSTGVAVSQTGVQPVAAVGGGAYGAAAPTQNASAQQSGYDYSQWHQWQQWQQQVAGGNPGTQQSQQPWGQPQQPMAPIPPHQVNMQSSQQHPPPQQVGTGAVAGVPPHSSWNAAAASQAVYGSHSQTR